MAQGKEEDPTMGKRMVFLGVCVVILATPTWVVATVLPDGTLALHGRGIAYHKCGADLPSTGNYDWWYGCSPTSAGMMMGYYDRNGLGGLVPGGVAEANSFGTPGAIVNDVIASSGHIADFWGAPDPLGSGRAIPNDFDCLADFMGTSQDSCGNSDGGTRFFYWDDGGPFTESDAASLSGAYSPDDSGMYGIGEYLEYAGYDAEELYNQYVDAMGKTYGFTLAQYQAEINAGRPVMIHVEGHSMCGYGYIDGTSTINVYDTWDPNGQNPGTLTWGGSYGGREHYGVTVLTIPEPTGLALLVLGLWAWWRRRAV